LVRSIPVFRGLFMNPEPSTMIDSGVVEMRHRTRSLSDYGVEYVEQNGKEFSDDGSTTAADDHARKQFIVDSANVIVGLPGSTDTSTEGSSDDAAAKNSWHPTAISTSPIAPAMFPVQIPGAFPGALNGAQMYLMSFAPNGAQVLMPVSQPGVSVASTGVVPWTTGLLSSPNQTLMSQQTGAVGSLEARAAALSAHAAEVRAAARRAKAAAAAARRQSNSGEHDEFCRMSAAFETEKQENAVPKSRTGPDDRTTLMLRNLPNNYTRTAVLDMLDSEGLAGTYCFVYVPTDFKNFTGFGYAFVGFCAHEHAAQAKRHYQGFSRWKVPSQKTCDVAWSGPVQGLEQHTERYRNSPVMHPGVPDEYKPAVFVNGVRAPFPAPTKRIRPPRLRHSIAGEVLAPGPPGEGHSNNGRRQGRRPV